MDRSMLASMREVETTHWWFVARRELLLAVMDKCVPPNAGVLLDVGCGTGANLEALAWRFPELTAIGLDADPFCRAACEARGLRVCDASAEALPVDDNSQDVITALDVLEHLDDDVSALQEMARTLSPDGVLVLTVPAYRWLWSPHDDMTHHRRRYTASRLVAALQSAGFTVTYVSYFNTLLFPLAAAMRLLERATGRAGGEQSVPPEPLNAMLRVVFGSERLALVRGWRLPYGLSLIAVAHRT